jgi:hypothetical protein
MDAPSKPREGSPIMRKGRGLHPKRLFSREGTQEREYPRAMGCRWCTFGNFGPLTTWRNGEVADALPAEPTEYGHSPLLTALLELGYLEEIQKGLYARGDSESAGHKARVHLSDLALECKAWAREEEYLQLMLRDQQLYRCQDEERDLFWDLSMEVVEAARHSEEGCKLHHHFVWTDTDDEGNEEAHRPTVRMIRSPVVLPGPPSLEIQEGGDNQQLASAQQPAPEEADDVLGDNWDDHLGWDADANIAAAEAAAPAEDVLKDPRITQGLEEADVLNAINEMKRQVRFKANGGEEPSLSIPSLVERVAVAILHDKPERDPVEVLREVKRSVLNMRLEYRENVERALKENLTTRDGEQWEASEGIPAETHLDAFELTPSPEPQDYLVDDDEVTTYLFKGELPAFADLPTKKRKEARRQIRDRAKKFHIADGRLFFLDKPPKRPNQVPGVTQRKAVITKAERDAVLRLVHDNGGHPSMPNTRKLIRDRFWWAGMYTQIGDYVRWCHNCQMTNQSTTLRTDGRTLTSTEVDMPLEKVGFDLLGPFPLTNEGYTYLYIWHDHFSGWVGAASGKTKNSSEVAAFLKMDLFASHLCPRVMVMDNDACVGEVQNLCVAMGTLIMLAAICSPWQNGGAEASVKYLTRLIRKLVLQYGGDWAEHLYEALIVVRICFRTATRLSPFEIIYGRQPV